MRSEVRASTAHALRGRRAAETGILSSVADCARSRRSLSVGSFYARWCPAAVEHRLLRPVGADVERELVGWRWEPVRPWCVGGRLVADVESERAIVPVREVGVLGAE